MTRAQRRQAVLRNDTWGELLRRLLVEVRVERCDLCERALSEAAQRQHSVPEVAQLGQARCFIRTPHTLSRGVALTMFGVCVQKLRPRPPRCCRTCKRSSARRSKCAQICERKGR